MVGSDLTQCQRLIVHLDLALHLLQEGDGLSLVCVLRHHVRYDLHQGQRVDSGGNKF